MSTNYFAHARPPQSGVLTGRFRRTGRLIDDEATTRVVNQAVARAKQGDREALRYLYIRYADHVYGYVASIVRDDHEAEDVTQHVFAKLLTKLEKYEPREVPFSAWIIRVARNVAVDHMRQRRAIPCEEVRELDTRVDDDGTSRDRSLDLRDALATLPEEQRQVVVMRHLIGLTPGEIAGKLGRTEPSIHGLHHRGRGALRSVLTDMQCGTHDQPEGGCVNPLSNPTETIPVTRLDQSNPALLEELLGVVEGVARKGAFTMGTELEAFEAEFAAYCGAGFSVGVSSGTEALSLALRALGVGYGDEVIVPTNSFIATAEAVSWVGATAKLVDVDPQTHLITAEAIAAAVGPNTKAVIPVHLMGSVVEMDPILELARENNLWVIEDTCQAHGAYYKGRRVGALGDIGCFSFYPTKNLGAWGDGGAIVTNNEAIAAQVRLLRSHGENPRYHHRIIGTTARLDALQAAILRVKLRQLDDRNDDRRRLGAMLREGLEGTSVELPAPAIEGADHVYHLFIVRTKQRDALRAHLEEHGVSTAVHYPFPIHRTEAYGSMPEGSLPGAEQLSEEICTLPLFPTMSDDEVARVIAAVASFDSQE